MKKISDIQSLVAEINLRKPSITVVDGYPGTGKSTIGSLISKSLDIPLVSLDSYLNPNQGKYLSSIRYEYLKQTLQKRPLIVEGICSLEILSRLHESYDCLVYITASVALTNSSDKVIQEVGAYHEGWNPCERADICFNNDKPLNPLNVLRKKMSTDRTAIDVTYIKATTQFAIVLACGGMLSLVIGLVVLLSGVEGQDETVVKIGGFNLSAKGLGAVIMGTSSVWAFFSYQSRPKYSHSREVTEGFDPESNRTYRREVESSTIIRVNDHS
ncbi:MAG: hypothetical protein NT070_18850 [Cyanobacteria bacterium]|nr:hypothetical protein [Cyanobacteriota bacterium]